MCITSKDWNSTLKNYLDDLFENEIELLPLRKKCYDKFRGFYYDNLEDYYNILRGNDENNDLL
jgi:hypothetical protein